MRRPLTRLAAALSVVALVTLSSPSVPPAGHDGAAQVLVPIALGRAGCC